MAARAVRLPRLTLFSGPNCSLCDIAKAELAKVRQTTIPVGDHKYTGPRSGKVEEEIRLLDSCTTPGGEGNCEGPVGCFHSDPGPGPMAEGHNPREEGMNAELFFIDTGSSEPQEQYGIYERATEHILGEQKESSPTPPDLATSRCFNCGSPEHVLSSCPNPFDRDLVSLSRQYFYFYQALRGIKEFQRLHVVEESRKQRLGWLEAFEPGEIRGLELREAIGDQHPEWLANMANWGYPRGWASHRDPRERVKAVILDIEENEENFSVDEISYSLPDGTKTGVIEEECDHQDNESSDVEISEDDDLPNTPEPAESELIRWAKYPESHFASHLLPIYNGFLLPPISHKGSATFTQDRQQLWQRIISGGQTQTPPWRFPGAFGGSSDLPPPPPSSDPPPLPQEPPPPPPSSPPPLPPDEPPFPPALPDVGQVYPNPAERDEDDDMDMDLSD